MCIYPFAALGYMSISARTYGLQGSEILRANPVLTITFLTAMLQPFAAWLLKIVQKRADNLDYANALVSVLLIFISECLFKNWVGIIGCAIIFYLLSKDMPYSYKKEFSGADWKSILKDATGPIVLILFAVFIFFASSRLG